MNVFFLVIQQESNHEQLWMVQLMDMEKGLYWCWLYLFLGVSLALVDTTLFFFPAQKLECGGEGSMEISSLEGKSLSW